MALTSFLQKTASKLFLSQGDGTAASPAVPYAAQQIGGQTAVLQNGVTGAVSKATAAASATTWKGGVANIVAYTDNGSDGGSWGSAVVKFYVRKAGRSKWIQLADPNGTAIAWTSDQILTLSLAACEIIATVDTGTGGSVPLYVEIW